MKTIGLDFDNTLVIYDELFYKLAIERDLIPKSLSKNKIKIRNYLRAINKDEQFTNLQSEVYGRRIIEAPVAPNAFNSLKKLKENYKLIIISHKTKYPYAGPKYDLHKACIGWLEKNKFFSDDGLKLKMNDIFFEPTKEEKIQRINNTNCNFYIDDLPEILENIGNNVKKILYTNNKKVRNNNVSISVLQDWKGIDLLID
tara:strand:- start:432 stop:1031 length:600 start_codon:yes stop_codon:yes gene_type:complete